MRCEVGRGEKRGEKGRGERAVRGEVRLRRSSSEREGEVVEREGGVVRFVG